MEKLPFNNKNPFATPEGYFENLQEQIMSRVHDSEELTVKSRIAIRTNLYIRWITAAACLVFIFVAAALLLTGQGRQSSVAESTMDEDSFYQWLYNSEKITLLAETLEINAAETFVADDEEYYENDDEIIRFLERDNISIAAIVGSIDVQSILSGNQ